MKRAEKEEGNEMKTKKGSNFYYLSLSFTHKTAFCVVFFTANDFPPSAPPRGT